MISIGPSLMCADMGDLREEIKNLAAANVDYFHFDIMDGRFVPNFTMGPDTIQSLRPYTNKPFDIHLMVEQPENYIELFANAGADMISIHAEATDHLQKALQKIKSYQIKAGVALNPSTPVDHLKYVIDSVDYINIMTVNPGFAGQSFIPLMYQKIKEVKEMVDRSGLTIDIQVDGNIGYETIPNAVKNGANMLVCGTSSLFKKDISTEEAVIQLRHFIKDLEKVSV